MNVLCTSCRRSLALALAFALAFLAGGAFVACGSSDLVVGDDTSDASGGLDATPDTANDSSPGEADALPDVASDAPPGSCTAAPAGPGICLPAGSACRQADTSGLICPAAGTFCCAVACPELAQPPPSFCDGGGFAPIYDAKACIVGFTCTPVACAAAGGACVALAPGSCASNHYGDAAKYTCGPGIGTTCCLP